MYRKKGGWRHRSFRGPSTMSEAVHTTLDRRGNFFAGLPARHRTANIIDNHVTTRLKSCLRTTIRAMSARSVEGIESNTWHSVRAAIPEQRPASHCKRRDAGPHVRRILSSIALQARIASICTAVAMSQDPDFPVLQPTERIAEATFVVKRFRKSRISDEVSAPASDSRPSSSSFEVIQTTLEPHCKARPAVPLSLQDKRARL